MIYRIWNQPINYLYVGADARPCMCGCAVPRSSVTELPVRIQAQTGGGVTGQVLNLRRIIAIREPQAIPSGTAPRRTKAATKKHEMALLLNAQHDFHDLNVKLWMPREKVKLLALFIANRLKIVNNVALRAFA